MTSAIRLIVALLKMPQKMYGLKLPKSLRNTKKSSIFKSTTYQSHF